MSGPDEFLFLAHRIPYPPDKGDKIRSFRLLRHLARRYRVHLAAFVDDPDDFAHQALLEALCASVTLVPLIPSAARLRSAGSLMRGEPLTFGYYRDARLAKAVMDLRARPLAGELAFSSSVAPYLEPAAPDRLRIADLCDADSEKWLEYAKGAGFPMNLVYGREHRRLAAAETAIINSFDTTFAISEAEAAIFEQRPGLKRRVAVLGNGVDTDYFAPASYPRPPDAADIVFTGAMDYKPNIDAAIWFATEVLPQVRARLADASFAIVGARPAPQVAALGGRDGVMVTGRVADVRPYLAHARLAVAPLQIARGVQNKVLEAMASGRPVVASADANVGVGARPDEEIVIAGSASAFAAATIALLEAPERAEAIGAAARARAARDFSWDSKLAALDAVLDSAAVPKLGSGPKVAGRR
jgi:sugar transferase (PEP-CTERM/EpsH1 system associated)